MVPFTSQRGMGREAVLIQTQPTLENPFFLQHGREWGLQGAKQPQFRGWGPSEADEKKTTQLLKPDPQ